MKIENIIYLHGYKGANSVKYQILKEYFESDYNVLKIKQIDEPIKNLKKMENEIEFNNSVLIGSSLGGFYGLYLSLKHSIPALLINPSFNPDLGQLKDEFPESHIIQFAEIKKEIRGLLNKNHSFNIHSFIADDDKLLDHAELLNLFRDNNIPVTHFEDKGHGFKNFQDELDLVKSIIVNFEK